MDIKEIEIPIFLHPHLFWIFWRKDTEKRLQLQNELAKEYGQSKQKDEDFTVGEVVVVKKNLFWKRGVIEKIVEGNNYEVWLLDYGYLEHTSTVYKLKSKFDLLKNPPLIHQASLWNVVFVNEDLNIENSSIDIHRNTLPNAGATLNALQFMSDYQLFFKKIKEANGILFGDIMYKKDGETSSLIKALVDKHLMVEDTELFREVESSRIKDKSFHSTALRQASKKHEDSRLSIDLSLLMDEVFMRNTSRGISLINNRELSAPETKSSTKNISRSELMKKLRRKSEARKEGMLSCTESEKEEIVRGGRSPSDMENQVSEASKLKKLIERRKSTIKANLKTSTEDVTSSSETNVCCESDNVSSATSKLAALKLRATRVKVKETREETDTKLKDDLGKPKQLQPSRSKFIPGGLRLIPKKKGTSDDTSDTSMDNTTNAEKSIQNSRPSSIGEFNVKVENNQSTNKKNSPQSKSKIIKKLTERKKMVLSNTSNASEEEILKENNVEKDFSEVTLDLHNNNKIVNKMLPGVVNKTADLLKNNKNCENNEESNTSCNSEHESSKKGYEEAEEKTDKATTDPDMNNESNHNPEKAADSQMVVKPFCTCSQCQFWTSSEGWDIGSKHFTEEEKCKRKKMRPQSLMLKVDRGEDVKLSSIEYRFMTKLEKNASFKILVHGRLIPQAIDRVVEAPFHNAIHKSLSKLKYIQTKKIQSYVWPAISRSMNVCYIHRKKSGKTLAYLPPVCSFLLEREERYNDLKKGGPIAVVLGKSSAECEEIYDLANKLVGVGHNKPRILLVTYPFQYVNLSSVDMLVTMPPILIELLKKNATNLKRLCHLILENIDVLLQKYTDEMKSIVAAIESMLLQRGIRQNVQMIMSGEHWTLKVEKFIMNLRDLPLISIGDYLEASIYGGIKLKVKLLEAKAKCDTVVDILRDKWKFHKSIVICNTNEEIELLKTALDLASISYIPVTDDLPIEHVYQNESNWERHCAGQFIVLICTDEVLNTMLSITSASLLIHFSLPSKWSFWIKRFYCLLENYKSPFTKSNEELKCEAYILTDELCVDQIPRLLSLLKNYNVSLQQFEPVCKQMEIKKEEAKINDRVPLCRFLKQFGYCHIINCSDRHLLDCQMDVNPSLPQNGTIKFKILELIDVNHLKVKIMEHKDIEGKITKYDSQKDLDDDKLTAILNIKKERAESIEKLHSYAYWDDEDFNDMFRECIVENKKKDVVDILVKKSGKRTTVSKSKIFQLPEEFSRDNDTDSCSTDVIIANFKPPYKDEKFSSIAYFKLSRYIEDIRNDDNIFVSNICLQLENTIWVNTISEEVNVYDLSLTKSNLTKELVKRQLAETNPEHMENLYSLCKEAEIILPKFIVPIQEQISREPPQETPQWAFLDVNSCNMVYFSSAVTPDEIYVRIAKFDSLLHNLEKDLTEVANRQGTEQDFAIIQGRYYLAKDPMEEKFVRVLVKRIEDSKVLCFSVDYGDEFVVPLSAIKYLSNYMIKKLPFQAIHCRLFGISSIGGEWPVEAVDVLYENFTFEADSDVYRTLYAKCIIYERGINKGQSFFSILLKDMFENPILINQLLIDCGWAALIPETNLVDFEVPVEEYESEECISSEDENNDLEKIKEIIETSQSISANHIVPKSVSARNNSKNLEENEDLEIFFGSGDEIDNFIHFIDAMNKTSEQTEIHHSTGICNTLPAIEAAPFEVDYFTPDVYWSQTKKRLDICIKLPNVETYNVKLLKSRIFSFETTVDEKRYVLNLVLYESVEKNFKHSLGGLEIRITFKKNKEEEWPKLCRSKERLRNVHYLLSKEQMEEDDNTDKLFLDLGEDFKDSTDDESDGVIFDVYSDRDSEYDLELPDDVDI